MLRRAATGFLIGVGDLVILVAIAARLHLTAASAPTLPGQAPWITARATGLTALGALTLDMVFVLSMTNGIGDRVLRRARAIEIHRWLSSVALTLTGLHALALTWDRVVRFDILDVIVPFASSYRRFAVALGVLAAYGALAVHVSFGLRRHIGAKGWRALHYASFFIFALAVGHALLSGSDAETAGVRILCAASAVAVGLLVYRRIRRAGQHGSPTAAITPLVSPSPRGGAHRWRRESR